MAGLVEELTLKADNSEQLEHAISIFMKWNASVSSYYVEKDAQGTPWMYVCWGGEDGVANANFFPTPLANPKIIADQIWEWLRAQFKGESRAGAKFPGYDGDGDGTDSPGFHLEAETGFGNRRGVYPIFKISPYYVYYSK
jgi:hypothetical protein